ncbi:hypothetical protein JY471_09420, partial [Stenotrophomonas maltophilia]|nr:hypothetical protein [Stenotrophomonas maltophilia]
CSGSGSTFRKPSRCAGGRHFDKVKEEATAAGGRRGTFVEMPATRAVARTLAMTTAEDLPAANKKVPVSSLSRKSRRT